MIPSAVTISLVEAARGGPFVYWDDLEAAIREAKELGFDAVELFAPGPDAVDVEQVKGLLTETGLKMAAVGTGAGMVLHRLSLTAVSEDQRTKAKDFVRSMIDFGAAFDAPAIIGSMQGRWGDGLERDAALGFLGNALVELGEHAKQYNVPLIYEPLNRYETNLCNTMAQGVALLESRNITNVVLLADLFHMNIEEVGIADGLRDGGQHIGHVHFVDSNRRPAGCGHMDYAPIVAALKEIGYDGYASAEAFPWPDPSAAARQTIESYRKYFGAM
ncbi:D-tagatose 3-epimerase [Maioricimonas rarisocia]|uniref:D-tagatose 3-epimerase n=1 Tax=Maioricimonas rarisocia TaxID=2528026 RepID=A0A517Z862_9PLAN|nr:sugar phosphate isomerase/epimerase family protein [Maioricimonas rarisocia]QDU38667.1 D-tagatose 3-epimerase [Maioricimonas rarisocia]